MSQPPQNGWGQPPFGDSHSQQPAPGGYGSPSQPSQGYGQDPSFAPSFGDGSGQGFAPQGAPPKKSNKLPIIICAGCAVLALLLIVVGGGIFLFTRSGGEPTGGGETTTQGPSEEPSEEPSEAPSEGPSEEPSEAPSEEPSEEPSEAPAGEGEGTKDSPYAAGQMFTLEDGSGGTLDVTIGAVNWDATEAVMGAYEFNTEPAEGETYILVPVEMTYHGEGTAEPFLALTVDYVTNGGNTYTDEGSITPNSSFDVGTLHDGGTGTWEVGIIIPVDQAQDGALTVDVLFNFASEPVWVAAG